MSRHRSFCFTWNNYPDDHQDRLDQCGYRYVLFGYEWAPTTGTPHLQGFLYFTNAKTLAAVIKLLPGVVLLVAKGSYTQNRVYCTKGGDYLEFGTPPQTSEEIGQAEADRYKLAWDLAKTGRV